MPEGPELRWASKQPPAPGPLAPARLEQVYGPLDGSAGEPGEPDQLWRGDNLAVLGHLRERVRGRVKLIYLDPPFNSRADYKRTIRLRGDAGRRARFEQTQYTDNWSDDEYLQFMYERLVACRELLDECGGLFLHCDWHQSHRLRCVLDELFGAEMFQNELIWHYYNKFQGNVGRFASNHDVIFFYSKSANFTFNRIRERRDKPVRQIKRVWSKDKRAIVNAKGPDGKIAYVTSTHKTIDDVWRLAMLQPADRTEAVGYPTQKPEALLERIILAASEPGDLVLDPFMGSGTTAAVALKLGRRFIGAERSGPAVHTSLRRLLRVREAIASSGVAPAIKNGLDGNDLDRLGPPRRGAGLEVYALDEGVGERGRTGRTGKGDGRGGFDLGVEGDRLIVRGFRPPALLRTLGIEDGTDEARDWRGLVDAVLIDPDYGGLVLRPRIVDAPGGRERVRGVYELPARTGTLAVRVIDLLGEDWTVVI